MSVSVHTLSLRVPRGSKFTTDVCPKLAHCGDLALASAESEAEAEAVRRSNAEGGLPR